MNFTIGLVFMILELLDISIGNTVNNQWFTQIGAELKLSLSLIRLTHALIWDMFGTNLGINGTLLTQDVVQWNMLCVKLIILVWNWNKETFLAKLEALSSGKKDLKLENTYTQRKLITVSHKDPSVIKRLVKGKNFTLGITILIKFWIYF